MPLENGSNLSIPSWIFVSDTTSMSPNGCAQPELPVKSQVLVVNHHSWNPGGFRWLVSHHLRNHTSHQGPDYSTEKCILFRGYWWKNQKCKMGEWDQAKHTRRKVLVSTLQKTKNFLDHVIINLHPSSIHDRDYRYFPSIPSNEIGFSNIMHMRCSVDMHHK